MSIREKRLDLQLDMLHDWLEELEGKRCHCSGTEIISQETSYSRKKAKDVRTIPFLTMGED